MPGAGRTNKNKHDEVKLIHGILTLFLFSGCFAAKAQVNPPRPIGVYVTPGQGMNFGAFFQGMTGGTVILYANGSRSATGDLVLANMGFSLSPAMFEIEAEPGTVITILNGPDVPLTGSNGGSITLHLDAANLTSPFITTAVPPARTPVLIGGTLIVGSPPANPSGSYSGTFSVTFIQQ